MITNEPTSSKLGKSQGVLQNEQKLRSEKVTREQHKMLEAFMKDRKDFPRGTMKQTDENIRLMREFDILTEQLNVVGPPVHSCKEWRKVWSLIKTNEKRRPASKQVVVGKIHSSVTVQRNQTIDVSPKSFNGTLDELSNDDDNYDEYGTTQQNQTIAISIKPLESRSDNDLFTSVNQVENTSITYTDIEYLDYPEIEDQGSNEVRLELLERDMIQASKESKELGPDETKIFWLSQIAEKQDKIISLLTTLVDQNVSK